MTVSSPPYQYEVAIIGAGFSGLAMAARLQEAGQRSFVILERANEVGGTWRDNTYPGCACDIMSHLYSFSFAPNPHWSRMYPQQPEILAYLKRFTDHYSLRQHLRLGTSLLAAHFEQDGGYWKLQAADGQIFTARTVVAALGPLNRPHYPDIPGLADFQGEVFHSAKWNHTYDLEGKRIAVIGTGASAIQFVPQIAPKVSALHLFQRSAPWIMPKPDRAVRAWEQRLFRRFPLTQRLLRHAIYWANELRGLLFMGNKTIQQWGKKKALKYLQKSVSDPELRQKLTPDYAIGCKRILISNDYYPALQLPQVQVHTEGIERITADAVCTKAGERLAVDAIILGTGFVAADFVVDMKIRGLDGQNLFDEWLRTGAQAYKGATVSGYPNWLFLVGPNTGGGHNSIVHIAESQVAYAMSYLEYLRQQPNGAYLDLKAEAQAAYNVELQQKMQQTVWLSGCKSWYLNQAGQNTTLYPGLNYQFRQITAKFDNQAYTLKTNTQTTLATIG
jgi:cation diffusion facilitator CzcD-associated flavoprotein CzcO